MRLSKNNTIRPVVWVGDSKKQLKKMPEDVQKQLGGELYFAQKGEMPPHGKPFKGIASGVFEIKDDFATNTYRLVYAVQIGTRLGSMSCTRFRRRVQRVSLHQKRTSI